MFRSLAEIRDRWLNYGPTYAVNKWAWGPSLALATLGPQADDSDTAWDFSDQENHGTLLPEATGPTWQNATMRGGAFRAVNFDGVNDFISTPIDLTDYARRSISCWLRRGGKATREQILGQDQLGGRVFTLEYNPTTTTGQRLLSYNGSTSLYGDDVANNTWVHVVVTEDGTNVRLYQNSALRATGAGNIPVASALTLLIGKRIYTGNEEPFDGSIADVRIYSRILSPAEIGQFTHPLAAYGVKLPTRFVFSGLAAPTTSPWLYHVTRRRLQGA